jgi:hypothetical protein
MAAGTGLYGSQFTVTTMVTFGDHDCTVQEWYSTVLNCTESVCLLCSQCVLYRTVHHGIQWGHIAIVTAGFQPTSKAQYCTVTVRTPMQGSLSSKTISIVQTGDRVLLTSHCEITMLSLPEHLSAVHRTPKETISIVLYGTGIVQSLSKHAKRLTLSSLIAAHEMHCACIMHHPLGLQHVNFCQNNLHTYK